MSFESVTSCNDFNMIFPTKFQLMFIHNELDEILSIYEDTHYALNYYSIEHMYDNSKYFINTSSSVAEYYSNEHVYDNYKYFINTSSPVAEYYSIEKIIKHYKKLNNDLQEILNDFLIEHLNKLQV